MQLPVVNGFIYPTAVHVVEDGEYLEVTNEQHEIILAGFNGEQDGEDVKFTVYKADGSGGEELTAKLRKNLNAAFHKHVGMVLVNKTVEKYSSDTKKSEAEARASIGRKEV